MAIQPTPEQAAAFQATLHDELRAAWQALRAARPDDTFYGFGLHTGSDASALGVVAFSTLGLQQAADRYATRYASDPALHLRSLRWSPADSPLLAGGDEVLARSQALRDAMPDPFPDDDDLDDDNFDDSAPDLVAKSVFAAGFAALKSLAKEGLFGRGVERESLVLSIWQYDESEKKKLSAARKLNPAAVVARYQAELEDGLKAYFKWSDQHIAALMKAKAAAKAAKASP